jgi:hypothetical protein
MQRAVRAILVGLEPGQASLQSIRGRRGYLCTDRAALRDEASLYEGRQRPHFAVQARYCGRAGEVLRGKGFNWDNGATENSQEA